MTQSELMDLIFERPGLYIGYASVVRMQAFIDGFGFGSEESRDAIYGGFTQWLLDQRLTRGQYSWSAITTMIGGSEQTAFKVAKDYWYEYKTSLQFDSNDSN